MLFLWPSYIYVVKFLILLDNMTISFQSYAMDLFPFSSFLKNWKLKKKTLNVVWKLYLCINNILFPMLFFSMMFSCRFFGIYYERSNLGFEATKGWKHLKIRKNHVNNFWKICIAFNLFMCLKFIKKCSFIWLILSELVTWRVKSTFNFHIQVFKTWMWL